MNGKRLKLQLRIWRRADSRHPGKLVTYQMKDVSPDMSFLEMIDVLNEDLILKGEMPVEFDSDCREGICGSCGMMIDGVAHGPLRGTTVCQLHMRHFEDGQTITIEPWRAKAFPPTKDLVVDRGAFDRIISAGGYVSVGTGGAPDGNVLPISKKNAERALDSASCIGCGACVAACPNASAALFTGAKIAQYTFLPQGQVERLDRSRRMVRQMDVEGFGNCSNHGECEAVCPKRIPIQDIAIMRREFFNLLVR